MEGKTCIIIYDSAVFVGRTLPARVYFMALLCKRRGNFFVVGGKHLGSFIAYLPDQYTHSNWCSSNYYYRIIISVTIIHVFWKEIDLRWGFSAKCKIKLELWHETPLSSYVLKITYRFKSYIVRYIESTQICDLQDYLIIFFKIKTITGMLPNFY